MPTSRTHSLPHLTQALSLLAPIAEANGHQLDMLALMHLTELLELLDSAAPDALNLDAADVRATLHGAQWLGIGRRESPHAAPVTLPVLFRGYITYCPGGPRPDDITRVLLGIETAPGAPLTPEELTGYTDLLEDWAPKAEVIFGHGTGTGQDREWKWARRVWVVLAA